MSDPETRALLTRVGETVQAVHDGLLTWVDHTLVAAGLEGVLTSSDFPPEGRTSPTLVLFPYRFGPDPALHSTARPCSLLGLGPDHRPGSVGLPEPWAQTGSLLTEAIRRVWPSTDGKPGRVTPVDTLPEPLAMWYRDAPEGWRALRTPVSPGSASNARPPSAAPPSEGPPEPPSRAKTVGNARLPSLWFRPGLSVTVDYLVTGGDAARGVLPSNIETTPMLLSALAAIVTTIHHQGGFDVTLQTQYADPSAAAYITAVAEALKERTLPDDMPKAVAAATKAEDVELAEALVQAAAHLNSRAVLPVGVLLTPELGNAELFSLSQALQRPLKASFCLRVSMCLGDILQFGPGTEVGLTFDALPRFKHEPEAKTRPRNEEEATPTPGAPGARPHP